MERSGASSILAFLMGTYPDIRIGLIILEYDVANFMHVLTAGMITHTRRGISEVRHMRVDREVVKPTALKRRS